MRVLNTIEDHLTRMDLLHRDRVVLVDEPEAQNQTGELTYARLVELVRAQAAGLDHLGVGRGERVVLTGPPPATIERLETEPGWACVQVSGLAEPSRIETPIGRGTEEIPLPATDLAAGG